MDNNFTIHTDRQGKLPVLTKGKERPPRSHVCCIEYINNRPVYCVKYEGQTQVWDYSIQKYVPLESVRHVSPLPIPNGVDPMMAKRPKEANEANVRQ